MSEAQSTPKTCFSCGGNRIQEEEQDGITRYVCLQCGEEWYLDADQSAPPGSKKRKPPERLAKTTKQTVAYALAAALCTFVCSVALLFRSGGRDLEIVMPYVLAAAVLGALLARLVPKNIAIVISGILMAAWIVLMYASFQ